MVDIADKLYEMGNSKFMSNVFDWNITRFDTYNVEDDIDYDSDEEQKLSEIPSIEFTPVDVKEIRASSTKD